MKTLLSLLICLVSTSRLEFVRDTYVVFIKSVIRKKRYFVKKKTQVSVSVKLPVNDEL